MVFGVKSVHMEQPKIESYLNYREFLSDFFEYKKNLNKNYSYRSFTMKAGLSSPSHLKMVIDGKRNLSDKSLSKIVKGFSFNSKTAEFLEAMVKFNQADDNQNRSNYFSRLIELRSKSSSLHKLENNSFKFLSNWYTVAIYVLVGTPDFVNDADWIQYKLNNKVSLSNINKSLEIMLDLSLIKFMGDKLVQSNGALSAGDDTKDIAVYDYHKQMLNLATEALDNVDNELKEFNGATVSISKDEIPLLKEKIRKFRKEINEITSNNNDGNDVYQVNVQLFPISRIEK